MKKIILFLTIFLLCGCSINGNRDFKKTCTLEENSNGFSYKEVVTIYFNHDDDITKIIDTYNYLYTNEIGEKSFEAAKYSLNNYMSTKKNMEKVISKDLDNEYEVIYTINVSSLSDDDLSSLDINRNYFKQIKVYQEKMSCK